MSYSSDETIKKIKFSIRIEGEQWKLIQPTEKFDKDRICLRLNGKWPQVICEKIWELNKLPCAFMFKDQKFYKREGFPYFKLFAKCKEKVCNAYLTGKCYTKEENGATISFECEDTYNILHTAKRPLSGETRVEAQKDLFNMKPAHFKQRKADELLNESGGQCPLLQTTAVFQTARQEGKDEVIGINRYPGDVITSVMLMMDEMSDIRQLSTIPLYVIYYTDNQLKLWQEVSEYNKGVVSIDASGSFVKKVIVHDDNSSADIFLYNIVTQIGKKIYTVCQALSATHTTFFIHLWLYEWISNGAPIPRETVMDCSSALLNAVSLAFNGCYYSDYLNWCLDLVKGNRTDVPRSLIKRDRAHLIKAFSKSKGFDGDHWIKKDFFMRCIAYALEISNVLLLEQVMTSIFIVSQSKYCDDGTECSIRKNWLIEKIATFDYESMYESKNNEIDDNRNYQYLNTDLEQSCTMSNENGINAYVHNIYNESLILCTEENGLFSEPNNYYLPDIAEYIVNLYSQFPAWTNIMNSYFSSENTVATSTRSECYYRIMKHDYNMNCPISLNRFLLNHIKIINGSTKLGRTAMKEQKLKQNKISEDSTRKNCNYKKRENVMNTKCDNFGNVKIKNSENKKYEDETKNDQDDYHLSRIQLYTQQIGMEYIVAYYDCSQLCQNTFTSRYFRDKFHLWCKDLRSLSGKNDISNDVITAFMIINCRHVWKNISFVPTEQTNYLLGDFYQKDKSPDWIMFNLNFHFTGTVFLPYCYANHWCLLILNIDDKTISHLNPFTHDDDGHRPIDAFLKYLNQCNLYKKNNLCQITWRVIRSTSPRQLQRDYYNCGSYIMFYMDCIAKGISLNTEFNPDEYRKTIARNLIIQSDSMEKVCLFCTNELVGIINFTCKICSRSAHKDCILRGLKHTGNSSLLSEKMCTLCLNKDSDCN